MMSLHKLSAGEGYTYLTRQVAAHDATERTQAGLAEYYSERGEAPGRWVGSGLAALGLGVGDVVTEAQMVALFGRGHHPLDPERPLGREFTTYAASPWRSRTALAFSAYNRGRGLAAHTPIPPEVRARIRTDVTVEGFTVQHGRPPVDPRELAGYLAAESAPKATPVAGYDLTFTPVKSVSALWALASRAVAEEVVAAHEAAVADVIGWLEREVAFTRTGHGGVRQVPVVGLVATAFRHRDSRDGDPNLHTHVAVSNKVQTRTEYGGRWLSLDGRVLFKAKVAASERYNTHLEAELVERLGVRFVERAMGAGKRPVREIDGISPVLLTFWSKRRRDINRRTGRLAVDFQRAHGRPPTRIETTALEQQANLETRAAKHEPRSEAEQRAGWRREAEGIDVDQMLTRVLGHGSGRPPTSAELDVAAGRILAALEESRATWQVWHVRAEALRQVRPLRVPKRLLDQAVEGLVTRVLDDLSVQLDLPDPVAEPTTLLRPDGHSVYSVHGSTRYTSARILDAEHQLLAAAKRRDGRRIDLVDVGITLAEAAANGQALDPSQVALVTALATSGDLLQVALAPAGTGKTTSMRALADVWRDSGGTVLGLAPSAVAARELGRAIGAHSDTLAKLTTSLTGRLTTDLTTGLTTGSLPEGLDRIDHTTLVVIDEAGMAATTDLAQVVSFVVGRGGSVRLVGDDHQLASVAAGGVLRDLVHQSGAQSLSVVHRFADRGEAAASLAIRNGDPTGLGYYTDHRRIHLGTAETAADEAYGAWTADRAADLDSLLLAPTRAVATQLNERARTDRLAGTTSADEVALCNGTSAGPGDLVLTRHNDRRLVVSDTDWVKNGDRWRVTKVHRDGSVDAARTDGSRLRVQLPAAYVAEHVQLGYAATIHSAQGRTVDTCHTVLAGTEDRQLLYVGITRGRLGNHVYLAPPADAEPDLVPHSDQPIGLQALQAILGRDGTQESATTVRRTAADPAARLHEAVLRYQDALGVAARRRLGLDPESELDPDGPLPWLPRIPVELRTDPEWGDYLRDRSQLISGLASHIAVSATAPWAQGLDPKLRKEVAVWRAAYAVPDTDARPTGPRVDGIGWHYQRELDRRIDISATPVTPVHDWPALLPAEVTDDPAARALGSRLSELNATGADVATLITTALDAERPLPAENPAAALWWRIVGADASTPRPEPKPALTLRPEPVRTPRPEHLAPTYPRPVDRGRGIGR